MVGMIIITLLLLLFLLILLLSLLLLLFDDHVSQRQMQFFNYPGKIPDFRILLHFLTFDDQVKLGSGCVNALQTELRFLCLQVYSFKIVI